MPDEDAPGADELAVGQRVMSVFELVAFERGRHLTGETRFLLLWFGLIFVFFSLARSKLPSYLLPLFPAASLLIARVWHDLFKAAAPNLHRGSTVVPIAAHCLHPAGKNRCDL